MIYHGLWKTVNTGKHKCQYQQVEGLFQGYTLKTFLSYDEI